MWEVLLYQADIVSLSMIDISRIHLIKVKLYLKCTVNYYVLKMLGHLLSCKWFHLLSCICSNTNNSNF